MKALLFILIAWFLLIGWFLASAIMAVEANAGEIYFVYKSSLTESDITNLRFLGKSSDRDMTRVTSLVPAPNTNYMVLEVSTVTNSEHRALLSLISSGSILYIGSRYMETYFDSRTGQDVSITRTKLFRDYPREYFRFSNVERSTP